MHAARLADAYSPGKKTYPQKLHPLPQTLARHRQIPATLACEYFLLRHTHESAAQESPAPLQDRRSSSTTRTPHQSNPALRTPSTLLAQSPPPRDHPRAGRDPRKAPAHPGSPARSHIQSASLSRLKPDTRRDELPPAKHRSSESAHGDAATAAACNKPSAAKKYHPQNASAP